MDVGVSREKKNRKTKSSACRTSELAMRKAKQGNVDRITYTRATGLLIRRQKERKDKNKVRKEDNEPFAGAANSWCSPAKSHHTNQLTGLFRLRSVLGC